MLKYVCIAFCVCECNAINELVLREMVYTVASTAMTGPLWAHLQKEGVHPTMFATEWFMTMFCRGFTFDLVTRVWDIYIAEGSFKIVYRVCLAILKVSYLPRMVATYIQPHRRMYEFLPH
jgi:hypothetical protein